MSTNEEKQAHTWGMICHLIALIGLLGIPFGNILGPLVVWLIKKNDHPFIDQQGKESLNFQLSMTIYFAISLLLALVLIGILMLAALVILDLVLVIIAAVKISNGEPYRYPLTIRFIS